MKYKLSSLSHKFSKNKVIAFYNSLKMRPVFVNERISLLIEKCFKNPFEAERFADYFRDQIPDCEKLLIALKENKILIDSKLQESNVIKMFRDNYAGKPYSSIMYIISTDQCNLRCKYCAIIHKFN